MDALKYSIIAIATSLALTSCLSKEEPQNQEERYNSIEKEIRKDLGFFENEQTVNEQNTALLKSALEAELENNDFFYANKYCDLLEIVNYPESKESKKKIMEAEATFLKFALDDALKNYDFENAKKHCNVLKNVDFSISKEYSERIKIAETSFWISQKSEDAANRLISAIDSRPVEKPSIGTISESAPAYDWQAKRHNDLIDEYFEKALTQRNEILIQKLLSQYVDEPTYETIEIGPKSKRNKVTGFTDQRKKEAQKKFEDAKKNW